ncbi:MAG TPA: NnrS family protein [Rhodocyclaceae bacterium]|nr:NnrS family protein [Rhodocyclaceae bacterium]
MWTSPFRPFYLLGAAYGVLLMLVWLGAYAGFWSLPSAGQSPWLWHGHEMVFGFAAAIISGIVLTALPSWAGTEEIGGGRLALLVGLWLAGRLALIAPLPALLGAALDCALFPLMAAMLLPQLLAVENRNYLWLLPVLAGLSAANVVFHAGCLLADPALAVLGLRLAIYSIILLYVLKAGVLTPIFTGNALREMGRGGDIAFIPWFDALAAASVVALAAADLAGLPSRWIGAAALAACLIHAARLARWRGWRVADVPLLAAMHLGYAWLVLAFALRAGAELSGALPAIAWLHAFNVGALGMMMLGLMTRVTLHHTGRPLQLPPPLYAAYVLMFAAAALRVAVTLCSLGTAWLALSMLLWAAPFAIYLALFGAMLWRPSLPRPA